MRSLKTFISAIRTDLFLLVVVVLSSFNQVGLVEHEPVKVSPENNIYPPDASAIIDVTKPPYNADKTGKTDCTDALIRAYDDALRPVLERFHESIKFTRTNTDTTLDLENNRGRVLFAHQGSVSHILYFPNGEYKVSNTIVYSSDSLKNQLGEELSRQIHFQGQSRQGVTIRLTDNAPGFSERTDKPVVSFMRGTRSNVAMSNTFENITINTGRGNPGAIGLLFHASNNGAVRHVTIRSGDSRRTGRTGLAITKGKPMGLITDVRIEGFDCGIHVRDFMLNTVFENIQLIKQNVVGFKIEDNPVSVRKLTSNNTVPAFQITGPRGHLVVVDSELNGGSPANPAIDWQTGFLFARHVTTSGYGAAIRHGEKVLVSSGEINEFSSHGSQHLFAGETSLNLPVEETPDVPWEQNLSQWISASQFGAKGDGVTDDTDAIQAAMDAGRSTVYFQPGTYLINRSITIPPTVQRVNFMFTGFVPGPDLKKSAGQGAFKVVGNSKSPLLLENVLIWLMGNGAHYWVEHASTRTLILKDIHAQRGSLYRNSVRGGTVFIENVSDVDKDGNCFSFSGQRVWARQLNPERANPNVRNDASTLWVLGFKTELNGVSFETVNGGKTEVLGGVVNNFSPIIPADLPIAINDESSVSLITTTNGRSDNGHYYRLMVREKQNGITRELGWSAVPRRYENQSVIPLYVGKRVSNSTK